LLVFSAVGRAERLRLGIEKLAGDAGEERDRRLSSIYGFSDFREVLVTNFSHVVRMVGLIDLEHPSQDVWVGVADVVDRLLHRVRVA
jgi:hypothetical protein